MAVISSAEVPVSGLRRCRVYHWTVRYPGDQSEPKLYRISSNTPQIYCVR